MSRSRPIRSAGLVSVLALVAAAAVVVWAGWWYAAQQRTSVTERWMSTLASMAADREIAIEAWVRERRGDADVIGHYPTVGYLANQRAGGPLPFPSEEGPETQLRDLLDAAVDAYDYVGVWVVRGDRVLVGSSGAPNLDPADLAAAHALAAGTSTLGGFVPHKSGVRLLFATFVPAARRDEPGRSLVVLAVDPQQYLYPLLAGQPFASETVESLLVARDGADVVFLSPVRLSQALRPFGRLPVSTRDLAAAQLLVTDASQGAFADYRDVPVLAAMRRVRGTPWGLVVKIDQREAYADLRTRLVSTAVAAASILLAFMGLGYGVVRNDRARAREALARSDARYAQLVDHADDVILYLTPDGRIVEANRRAVEAYGYARTDLIGRHVRDLRVPETRSDVDGSLGRIARQDHLRFETEHVRKDGTRFPVEIHARRVVLDAEPMIVAIIRDTTDRREQEAALRAAQQQFQQAQRLEAVGRLAAGVAHDFNNLLTVITGYTDLLAAGRVSPEGGGELAQIRDAADRAAGLTRQLLAFSRQQVLEPRVLNPNQVVNEVTTLLQRVIGEDVRLEIQTAPALGNVEVDQGQLGQVLMNLAVNARDAMPQGGTVTIGTADEAVDEAYAREHQPIEPGPYVALWVTDTGAGMDAETRARVFEPFFTTKPPGQGTGLGLSMVYGFVKQSGGFIWVESEPGRGTTFRIYLPRVDRKAQSAPAPAAAARRAGAGETVLVVEDQPMLRNLVKRVLESHGYRTVVASDGATALEAAKTAIDRIALLVTDVVLPDLGGAEVAERLRAARPDLPVLFMSGYSRDAAEGRLLLTGRASFLPKPFTPNQLLEKVREALNG